MKIIEALKQLKYLKKKTEDLQSKIQQNSADMDLDTPLYQDMRGKVSEWLQSHRDVVKELLRMKT